MMEITTTMCYSQLMTMLLHPKEFSDCVRSFTSSSPDIANEGFNGYMETKVTFNVVDVVAFAALHQKSYVMPSDRTKWYHIVRDGKVFTYET